jgi:predicted nucleotide-binding protein
MGVPVRSYAFDFTAGSTILEEIEAAARECTCGIFLFTKDDPQQPGQPWQAAPRDNVVFEAGFFMSAKGRERTLIIREEGAKMPADVGGGIYLGLKDRNDISPIQHAVSEFLHKRL